MKKIIIAVLVSFFTLQNGVFATSIGQQILNNLESGFNNGDLSLQGQMIVGNENKSLLEGIFGSDSKGANLNLGADNAQNVTIKDFFRVAQKYILGIIALIAISVFIYIGYLLASAEGKEDQFKKGIKALIYAMVGLAVIPLAYVVIKITTGFTF